AWDRTCIDRARAGGSERPGPPAGRARRRRAVLRSLQFQADTERTCGHARSCGLRAIARVRTCRGCLRRRFGLYTAGLGGALTCPRRAQQLVLTLVVPNDSVTRR